MMQDLASKDEYENLCLILIISTAEACIISEAPKELVCTT